MKKTRTLLFSIALVLIAINFKAQTCTSPVTVAVNNGFMGVDSFANSSTRFLRFTADNDITKIKLFIKNYNSSSNVINIYNNDCANLATNKLTGVALFPQMDQFPLTINGDSIEVVSRGCISGNQYLIEIGTATANPSTYTKYNISIGTSSIAAGCFLIGNGCSTPTCELVCNGSFEDMAGCVNNFGQISNASSWFSATVGGSPDLYSSTAPGCSPSFPDCGVPCNLDGTRSHITTTCTSQKNYALILNTYIPPGLGGYQYAEYLETGLKSAMVAGQSYVVSFYVSKAQNGNSLLNKLSYWLTPNMINLNISTPIPTSITPSGTLSSSSILNTYGWTKVSFCYTSPSGGEQFLTIGIPNDPSAFTVGTNSAVNVSNCASFNWPPNPGYTQSNNHSLYIDEVSVVPFQYSAGANQTVTPCGIVNLNATAINCGTTSLSPLTYTWTSGITPISTNLTATANVNATTTNSVFSFYAVGTAIDGSSCISSSYLTVSSTTPVPLVITPSANSVCPGSAVTLTASAGVGTYTWLPGSSNSNPVTFTPTANTTYTLIGNTSNGCTITQTMTIYTYTDVISVSSSTPSMCQGATATLTASGGSSYTWSPGNSTVNPLPVSPSSTTVYTVTGITTAHSCTKTNTISITINPLPSLTISPAVSNSICLGSSITLVASGASTYTWTSPSTVSASITVTPTVNTTYTVTGTSSFGCVSTSTSIVYINGLPTISCSTNKPLVCQSPSESATLSATGANTYVWYPGPLSGGTVAVTPTSAVTNYTVIGTNTLTGCTNSCVVTQSMLPISYPWFTVTATPSVLCASSPASTLTATGSPNNYTWMPGSIANTPSVAITSTTNLSYTAASTNSAGCLGRQTVTLGVTEAIASFTPFPVICGIQTFTLSDYLTTPGAGTYSINGVAITGSVYTFTSSASGYTVGYTYTAGIYCNNTATIAVTTNTACCTSTLSQITNTLLSGSNTINGGQAINQDITISGSTIFQNGEFIIAPNVKITVQTGAELKLFGAHLYACQSTQWNGIDVQFNGRVIAQPSSTTGMSTFIEDAKTAINIQPITSTLSAGLQPIEINNTIFNKNYIAVNINTVTLTGDLPMTFYGNVLTCRSLTFTTNSGSLCAWPTTGTVTASQDLRAAMNPTTGLTAPYTLQSAATTTCLAPNANLPSKTGFSLTAVGTGNTSNGITIGSSGSSSDPTDFNLFDALAYGIYSNGSNINVINNVFQNTRQWRTRSGLTGGTAIYYAIFDNYFYKLNLTNTTSSYSLSPDVGNRFWDCFIAVEAYRPYQFNMDYNTVRSTQSTSSGTVFAQGNTGVYITTNRFSFYINKNEFTNVRYPINLPIVTGTWDSGSGNTSGIYAHNLAIINNSIAGTSTVSGSYVSDAITVSSPNAVTWYTVAFTGLSVNTNTINTAYRGINVSGMNSYSTSITSNSLTNLVNDAVFSASQYAIKLTNTQNAAIVTTNTLSAANNTNTAISMVYIGSNSGSSSPSVTCNNLNSGYRGFEFNSTNSGTIWKGNIMNGHQNGMALTNTAVIGAQGSTVSPSGNQWNGSWTGTNYCTYVEVGSDAASSKLYVTASSPYQPINNFGSAASNKLYSFAGNTVSATGSYSCGGGGGGGGGGRFANTGFGKSGHASSYTFSFGNLRTVQNTVDISTDAKYIAAMSLYRNLDANDSIRNSDSSNVDFYNALTNTSIAKFVQADKYIYDGQPSSALAIKSSVTPVNNVENNYSKFYDLYYNYSTDNLSDNDIVDLQSLANLCPGKDGAIVYSARALFNVVTKAANAYNENCSVNQNERTITQAAQSQSHNQIAWDVNLFPNPTSGELNVLSKNDAEQLQVTVRDVSGKIIDKRNLAISGFIGKLGLDLADGIYFITISNHNNETITKKLVINR
jgi:hypothetical protein